MSTPPTAIRPRRDPSVFWALLGGALLGVVMRLLFRGEQDEAYAVMLGAFVILVPIVVGAVAVFLCELNGRHTFAFYFVAGACANMLFVAGTFVILIEGLICAIIAMPLFAVLGGLAGLLMGAVCRWTNYPRHTVYALAALPLLLGAFEQRLPLPERIHTVTRSRVIAADASDVWAQLVSAPAIQPDEVDDAWMYRIGVPTPESALTDVGTDGAVRHIRMGRGVHFDQVAAEWEPGRRVRWLYRFEPDSFPSRALDDHVRIGGRYFDLVDTEYDLVPAAGATILRVRMSYRVSTRFNWYAGPLADWLVGNFEETALRLYARRAESSLTR